MASKRSTPNIPRLERVKVPTKTKEIRGGGAKIRERILKLAQLNVSSTIRT